MMPTAICDWEQVASNTSNSTLPLPVYSPPLHCSAAPIAGSRVEGKRELECTQVGTVPVPAYPRPSHVDFSYHRLEMAVIVHPL